MTGPIKSKDHCASCFHEIDEPKKSREEPCRTCFQKGNKANPFPEHTPAIKSMTDKTKKEDTING